ncbi:hypothetical protein HK098_004816 [Nowakowskiella sp. JEL0407]|nr:hypothetical protein HK098_004816 [Nowakowskiella sp. JEL0407]
MSSSRNTALQVAASILIIISLYTLFSSYGNKNNNGYSPSNPNAGSHIVPPTTTTPAAMQLDYSAYEAKLRDHLSKPYTEPTLDTPLADLPTNFKVDATNIAELVKVVETLGNKLTALETRFLIFRKWEWAYDLGIYDNYKEYSQTNTDSILQFIFQNIGTTNKYYVEFGTENGLQTNSRYLREHHGWMGLLMDGGFENATINLHKEFIYKSNIVNLFKKYKVPKEFDMLSVDIDYNTYWVWKAIDHKLYRPRVVVVEYNAEWSNNGMDAPMWSAKDCEKCVWNFTNYYGANAKALWKLGRDKGYTLVYTEFFYVNLYFIRTDLIGDQALVDELFPFKRVFRPGKLNLGYYLSPEPPAVVNGLED